MRPEAGEEPETFAVHSRLSEKMLAALDEIAAAVGFSRSRMIRAAVRHALIAWAKEVRGVDRCWVNRHTGEIRADDPRTAPGRTKPRKGGGE